VNREESPAVTSYFLQPGYIFMAREPAVISTVLGSSVAVCIFDRKRYFAGMNHFLYPAAKRRSEATALYGNAATLTLIRMMLNEGAKTAHLEAQIMGGAHNPEVSPKDIGRENLLVARRILRRERIAIVSEDCGGSKGRKVVFTTHSNESAVLKVDRLRGCDWYPYDRVR